MHSLRHIKTFLRQGFWDSGSVEKAGDPNRSRFRGERQTGTFSDPNEGGGQAERFAIAGEGQTAYDEACCENAIFLNRQGFI